MKLSNTKILVIILILGSILRFFNLLEIPYTHDEFSALFRTQFDSFSELIKGGIVGDTLPAGIQVFLYFWTKLFGFQEWIVKLPFLVAGILSIWLMYLIGRIWFNETVGLISSAFVASLQYTVFYSQIARPYSSGLFLVLTMVYYWSLIIRSPEKKFLKHGIFFVLFATLSAYNHHFSLLFAAIVCLSGLWLVQWKNLIRYITACFVIIVLYLPHLKILFLQLQMGGNEGWLGPFHWRFIIDYFRYSFQFSAPCYILVLLLIIESLIKENRDIVSWKKYLLFSIWFFAPIIIGSIYSLFFNNVMQYSVLIFSFPFLFFLVFGQFKPLKPASNLLLVIVILSVNTYSLIYIRHHYTVFYESQYIHLLTDRLEAEKSYKDIPALIDSDKKISGYYLDKYHIDSNFTWFDEDSPSRSLLEYLKQTSKTSDELYFGCMSYNWPLTVPVILDYYPGIILKEDYAGGNTYIFSKKSGTPVIVVEQLDFDSVYPPPHFWHKLDSSKYVTTYGYSHNTSYRIDSAIVWCPSYSRRLKEIIRDNNDIIDVSVKVDSVGDMKDVVLVTQLEKNGKVFYWNGMEFETFLNSGDENKWLTVHSTIDISNIQIPCGEVILKIYIWNKGHREFHIDDFIITLRQGNPIVYGWYNEI